MRRHRQLEHELAVVAVDDMQDAFLAGGRDELAAARVEQRHRRLRPSRGRRSARSWYHHLSLPVLRVERHRRDREQVGARAASPLW